MECAFEVFLLAYSVIFKFDWWIGGDEDKKGREGRAKSGAHDHMNETWGELFVSIMKWNNGGCDLLQLENGIFGISIGGTAA